MQQSQLDSLRTQLQEWSTQRVKEEMTGVDSTHPDYEVRRALCLQELSDRRERRNFKLNLLIIVLTLAGIGATLLASQWKGSVLEAWLQRKMPPSQEGKAPPSPHSSPQLKP
jgi:hypothetical protein